MPSIYQLKSAFQNLLRPGVKVLVRLGVTANQVTLTAMLISVALGLFLYLYYLDRPSSLLLLLLPLWMLLRMAFNAIDGMLAREFNQQSRLGAFYNELCDIVSDTALYLCLLAFQFISPALLLLMSFLAILSEYTGVMAPLIGAERRYDGPMGKSDRAFWISVIAVIIVVYPYFSTQTVYLSYIVHILIAVVCLLLALTIYNRIRHSL